MLPPKAVRPALQRLLGRPSTLKLLRVLVSIDVAGSCWELGSCQHHQARNNKTYAQNHIEDFERDRLFPIPVDTNSTSRQYDYVGNADFATAPVSAVITACDSFKHISRYEMLKRESNVLPSKDRKTLLVDTVEHRHNVDLWLLLLQFRKRIYGLKGISTVWDGIRARNVDLPTRGPAADLFWKAFISLGQSYERSTESVIDYATSLLLRSGCYYDKLYEEVISYWLKFKPKYAIKWHKSLCNRFPPPRGVLIRLCAVAATSKVAMEAFRFIYSSSLERNIYDRLISIYCASGDYNMARYWHNFLTRRGDFPSENFKRNPYHYRLQQLMCDVPQLSTNSFSLQNRKVIMTSEKQMYSPDGHAYFSAYRKKRDLISTLLLDKLRSYGFSDYFSTRPGILDDKICARLISTKAFSLNIILEFLAGLGVKKIGPVALRELALRVIDLAAIAREIKGLEDVGIAVEDNAFSKAVKHFVKQRKAEVLWNMLHSDLHPDAYGDIETQQRLLLWYLKKKMWIEANRTLEVLALDGPQARSFIWNTLLKYFIRSSAKWRWVKYMDKMKIYYIPVNNASVKCLFNHRLALRQVGRNTSSHSSGPYDNISSYANLCVEILIGGESVPIGTWREIIKRLGMAGHMDELAFLLIRLARTYLSGQTYLDNVAFVHLKASLAKNRANSSSAINMGVSAEMSIAFRNMFNEPLIDAILSWGFINGGKNYGDEYSKILLQSPRALSAVKLNERGERTASTGDRTASCSDTDLRLRNVPAWAKAIQLISQLQQLGIPVNSNVVVKSVRHRLWTLYGPAVSTRPRNREMKRLHRFTLMQTIALINKAWGSPLLDFAVDDQLKRKESLASKATDIVEDFKDFPSEEFNRDSSIGFQEQSSSSISRRERFLVYVFGEKRYISKSEKRRVLIREWARLLEESNDTAWIGL